MMIRNSGEGDSLAEVPRTPTSSRKGGMSSMLSTAVGMAKGAMARVSPKLSRASWGSSDAGKSDLSTTNINSDASDRTRVTRHGAPHNDADDDDDVDVDDDRDSGAETPLPDIDSEDEELPPLPGSSPPEVSPASRRRVPRPEAIERAVWAAVDKTRVDDPKSARARHGGSRLAGDGKASDPAWLASRDTDGTEGDDGTGSAEDDPGSELADGPLLAAARRATRFDPPLKFRA